MYSNRFLAVVIFSLGFISACSNTIEVENLDYEYIKNHIDKLEYTYGDTLISKLDTLKRLPQRKVEEILKEVISNPKDIQQLRESVFYAGILELEGLNNIISNIHSYDLFLLQNKYFYYYKINRDKQKNLQYLKFFCDISGLDPTDENVPPSIHYAMYGTIYLLGWIFEEESLNYLKSLDASKFDGGLSETHWESIQRIEFLLKKYEK
jgi:hypothetical protein